MPPRACLCRICVAFNAVLSSIPPLDAGGIAGGVKFLVNDIFFKVASDEHGLYGSYQYAQKAALLYVVVPLNYLLPA